MKQPTFKTFFTIYGDTLYGAYAKAKSDGNDEGFVAWVMGEYDCYVRDKTDYEVPYTGILD